MWFKALDEVRTPIISSALYLTPFLSLIDIRLFLQEPILISSFVGLLIIVGGIFLGVFSARDV